MKRLARILLVLLGSALLILVLLAAWVTWVFDPNDHRERLGRMISQETGLELAFTGPIQHYMLNGLHLSLRDVGINSRGQRVAELDRLSVQLALRPLLDRDLLIENLTLELSDLNLVRDADGGLFQRPKTAREAQPPPEDAAGWLRSVHIEKLDIKLVSATYRDPRWDLKIRSDSLHLQSNRLPVMRQGKLLLDNPSWMMRYPRQTSIQVEGLDTGGLKMARFDLRLHNRDGNMDVERLHAQMSWTRPDRPVSLALEARGKGTLNMDSDAAATASADPGRGELGKLAISAVDLELPRLSIAFGEDRIELTEGRLRLPHAPLITAGRPARSLEDWFSRNRVQCRLSAAGLRVNSVTLEPIDVDLRAADDRLEIQVRDSRLQAGDAGDGFEMSAGFGGSAVLAMGAQNGPSPRRLHLEALELTAQDGRLITTQGLYGFDELQLGAADLPLLIDGKAADWSAPRTLARHAPALNLRFQAQGLHHGGKSVERLALQLARQDQRLEFRQLGARLGDTEIQGNGLIDLARTPPGWRLRVDSPRIDLAPLFAFFNASFQAQGDLRLALDLAGSGLDPDAIPPTLHGILEMAGRNIQVQAVNLDEIIAHLEKTQNVGLLDVGAYAIAGPAGALLTKGRDYSSLIGSAKLAGDTQISEFHSELVIDKGVIELRDVAMRTSGHRLAAEGELDLKDGRSLDLRIATLDPQGCAKYLEQVGGTVGKPEVDQAGVVIKGVINPVKSVLEGLVGLVAGGCDEPFYTGQVGAAAP